MCVWFRGQQHAPRPLEPQDQRHDSIRGAIRSPAHSKAVNLQRRCPPDASLTCTWGTISSSVSWDGLGLWRPLETLVKPWLGPPHRGMMGGQGQGDPDTHWELLTLSYSAVSPLQSSWNRLDRVQVEGLGGYLFLRGRPLLLTSFIVWGTWHPTHFFEVQKVAQIVRKMSTSTVQQHSSAWQGSIAVWIHRIAN